MRISTTTLESFRLFMQPDNEWMAEAELMATIRGEFVPNAKVLLGQAFGAVLEDPDRYRIPGGYSVLPRGGSEPVVLGDDVMGPALALIDRPLTIFEAKAAKRYGRHDVVAKADQLLGAHLIETKATLSTFDFDKYAASCQWRFMLDIFDGARKCTYRVFCLHEDERTGVVSLRSVDSFDLYPYAELHQDCAALVSEFESYVAAKGLTSVLDARQVEAA
jgi:hypothetical protein